MRSLPESLYEIVPLLGGRGADTNTALIILGTCFLRILYASKDSSGPRSGVRRFGILVPIINQVQEDQKGLHPS
jgi:hypothetical protein